MKLDVAELQTPYRSGRFAISGEASDRARSVLLGLREQADGAVVGVGEAVPSLRVLDMDEAGIRARLAGLAPWLGALRIDPDCEAPSLPAMDTSGPQGPPRGPVACGLDGALLDAWARARGQPLWRAMGLPRPRIATTATVSLGDPQQMAQEARGLLDAGFSELKVKLGEAEADPQRLQAVREAAPRARIRVDANEGWNRDQCVAMVNTLAEVDVELVEQPLSRSAGIEDHHAVNRALEEHGIPHVLDETVHTAEDARQIAKKRLAHGVNLKLQKAGGLRAGLGLIEAARSGGLKVMVGCFIESWAGIALALQLAGKVDWADLDGAWLLAEQPVVPRTPLLRGGLLEAGDEPGLGVEPAPGVLPG